jgi:acyl carrier protein
MSQLTSSIAEEITEIVAEILELEPFEVAAPRALAHHCGQDQQRAIEILLTLQCAFGVTIDHADLARMETIDGMVHVVLAALNVKWAARGVPGLS